MGPRPGALAETVASTSSNGGLVALKLYSVERLHFTSNLSCSDFEVPILLCFWASTAELEQNFSYLKLFESGKKLGAEYTHAVMKVLLDGPSPSQLSSLNSSGQYVVTERIQRVQRMYLKLYGSAKNQRNSVLPRRTMAKAAPKGLSGLLRNRQAQMQAIAAGSSEDGMRLAELPDLTELEEKAGEQVENLKKRNAKQIASASKNLEQKQALMLGRGFGLGLGV